MFAPGTIASQTLLPATFTEPPPDPAIPTGPARYWRLLFPTNQGSDEALQLLEAELLDAIGGSVLSVGGTASASAGTASLAFDGTDDDVFAPWTTGGGGAWAGAWLAYDLGAGNEAVITAARLRFNVAMRSPGVVVLESSTDGSTWTARGAADPASGTAAAWNDFDLSFLPRAYVCAGAVWAGTSGTSRTMAGLPFGPARADRLIIVGIVPTLTTAGSRSITGVTIGGETATEIVAQGNAGATPMSLWAARPTGLSGDVVVTCDAAFDRLSVIAVHAMAPVLAADVTDADTAEIALTIPADGFVLALMGTRYSSNASQPPGISDMGDPPAPHLWMAAGSYNQLQLSIERSPTAKAKTFSPALPLCGAAWAF